MEGNNWSTQRRQIIAHFTGHQLRGLPTTTVFAWQTKHGSVRLLAMKLQRAIYGPVGSGWPASWKQWAGAAEERCADDQLYQHNGQQS